MCCCSNILVHVSAGMQELVFYCYPVIQWDVSNIVPLICRDALVLCNILSCYQLVETDNSLG